MPSPAEAGVAARATDAGSWRRARPWLLAAVAAAVLSAATSTLPLAVSTRLALQDGLQMAAAAAACWACIAAGRDATGNPRRGWFLLGAGAGAWTVGQAIWSWYEVGLGVPVPFPGWADAAYLALYPFAILGILLLTRVSGHGWVTSLAIVVDAVISALAVSLLAWPLLLHGAFHEAAGGVGAYVTIAYPLADIVLLALVGGILMRAGGSWRSALGLAYAAFWFILLADLGYATGIFEGTYATGRLSDAGWSIGFLVLAAAARAPLPAPVRPSEQSAYLRVVGHVLPIVAILVGLAAAALAVHRGVQDFPPWRLGLATLFVAAALRQALAGLEYVAVQRQGEAAQTDYKRLFDNMTEGVAHGRIRWRGEQATDFVYLGVNPRFRALTGLGEVVGRLESEVIPGFAQDNAELLDLLARVARGGPPERVEKEVPGLGRWFSITAYGAGHDEFVAIFDDITARKATEKRLLFQAHLLDSVGQAVVATDTSGRITYWGPGAVALYGWEAAEVLGRPVIEVTPSETSKDEAAEIFAKLAAGRSWSGEIVLRRKDGSAFTALVHDTPMFEDGRLTGIVGISQDISPTKRLQSRLDFKAHLLANVSQAVIATDLAGNVTYWNIAAERLFGWTRDAAMGRPITEFWGETLTQRRGAEAGILATGDYAMRRKDGSQVLVNMGTSPLLARGGGLQGFIAICQDVTAQRAIQEDYRKVVQGSPAGIFQASPTGQILFANPAFVSITGYGSLEELRTAVAEGMRLCQDPADQQRLQELLARDGHVDRFEFQRTHRDGSLRWLILDGKTGTDVGGAPILEGFVRDVTEIRRSAQALRESEAGLREAQDMAHIGAWDLDLASGVATWSEEMYRLFNRDPATFTPTYAASLQAIHPDDRDLVDRTFQEAVATHRPYALDHRILLLDGTVRHVSEQARISYDAAGRPVRAWGTAQDITERKHAEDARRAGEAKDLEVKRLDDLNKMRMEFLNTAAHDLMTPLTPLKLQMATLRRSGSLDADQARSLEIMDRSVLRFQALVEDMLEAARLQAGKLQLRRADVPLAPMVQEAAASFEGAALQGQLQVELDVSTDARVDVDRMKCMQVLVNLVSNAVKYTPAGGHVRIRIIVTLTEAIVEIADDGLGMSPEQLGQLFKPFVRLHAEIQGAAKGTGLGLYICKGIVEQHGGRLWAESAGPGHGSTFHVAWPLAKTGVATGAVGTDKESGLGASAKDGRPS